MLKWKQSKENDKVDADFAFWPPLFPPKTALERYLKKYTNCLNYIFVILIIEIKMFLSLLLLFHCLFSSLINQSSWLGI